MPYVSALGQFSVAYVRALCRPEARFRRRHKDVRLRALVVVVSYDPLLMLDHLTWQAMLKALTFELGKRFGVGAACRIRGQSACSDVDR